MADKIKFWPIRGTEAQIKQHPAEDGKVYFSTDTNKIYLDVNGSHRLMGNGNSGIIYANGSDTTIIPESEESSIYTISFKALDNNGDAPQLNSLILNSDGRFFRVTAVDEINSTFTATLLAVSGSGGGGGTYSILRIEDISGSRDKYFIKENSNAQIQFVCYSSVETLNRIESITYSFGKTTINDDSGHPLNEIITFNIGQYLNDITSNQVNLRITVTDSYQSRQVYDCTIHVVELALSSTFSPIYKVDKDEDTSRNKFRYFCVPNGSNELSDKRLQIKTYSENNLDTPLETINLPIQFLNSQFDTNIDINDLNHGNYIFTVQLLGDLNDETMSSNVLSYHLIVYEKTNPLPILTALEPVTTVEQYSSVTIPYMLAYSNMSGTSEITQKIGLEEAIVSIPNNTLNNWVVSFNKAGSYDLELRYNDSTYITFPTITVIPYTGNVPQIYAPGDILKLNLSAQDRANNQLNKDQWTYNNITSTFENFKWGTTDGWTKESNNVVGLKLINGAKTTINYRPFEQDAGINGLTIEFDFKVTGVTDYSKPLISCLSYDSRGEIFNGIQITGQESTLSSNNIHTAKDTIVDNNGEQSEEQIAYNTKIQALTSRFVEDERMHVSYVIGKKTASGSKEKPLVKTYLNGVISGISEYENDDYFVDYNNPQDDSGNAYIIIDSTYGDIYIYNIRIYDAPLDGRIILNNYLATLPTIGDRVEKYSWNNIADTNGNISYSIIRDRTEYESYNLNIPYILLTGGHAGDKSAKYKSDNSSTEISNLFRLPYAKKDYRLMSMEYIDPNNPTKNFNKVLHFVDSVGHSTYDINEVDTSYTADDGVLVYGQGTSSMEYPVKNLRIKLLNSKFQVYKDGYPVNLLCFKADYMESSGSHNTGTGNLIYDLYNGLGYKTPAQRFYENLSDPDLNYKYVTAIKGYPVIIFHSVDGSEEHPYEFVGKYNLNLDKATQEPFGFFSYDDGEGHRFGLDENNKETIHCVEWLNNSQLLCNFKKDNNLDLDILEYFNSLDEDNNPMWESAFESRYPDGADLSQVQSFKNLVAWIHSTSQDDDDVTNEVIEPITYDGIEYTIDSKEYRLAKFKNEIWNYMDKDFTLFYYVLTHILLMIDSRAKNMMMATWDDQHWYPIFYDMDTMLGLNNYGYNKFNYDLEDTAEDVYNGQSSILWNNIRIAFPNEIAETYRQMRSNGLTYQNLIATYNNTQADAWNEVLCNADAQYKYVRPYVEGFMTTDGDGVTTPVKPYGKSYMYAAQGRRSFHRQWWLNNRLKYFDGKYKAGNFDNTNTNINMRIYSLEGTTNEALIRSKAAVPPSPNFILTPFKNAYVSVKYGANAEATAPIYAMANTPQEIVPSGVALATDTETYICGSDQLKDIGDLSNKYLGNITLTANKLTKLIIGNHHPDYRNTNLSEGINCNTSPYLEEIDITNTFVPNLNLVDCMRLKKVFATGCSKLTSIQLPPNGIIEELRLPTELNTLNLDNLTYLTDFTLGTLEVPQDENNNYLLEDAYYQDAGANNLISINIKNTPINSYDLVMNAESLQRYLLTNVNWYITEDSALENNQISILEKLKELSIAENNVERKFALTGILTIGVDNNEQPIDAYAIYKNYIKDIYPNLIIQYDIENHPTMRLSDVITINFFNYNNEIQYSAVLPQSPSNEERTEELYDDILTHVIEPTISSTVSTTYQFNGWNFDENLYETKQDIKTLLNSLSTNANFIPQFTESVRKYTVKICHNEEGTNAYYQQIEYNKYVPQGSLRIEYKDDSDLPLYETYKFKGYTTEKGSNQVVDICSIPIQKDWTFYPVFNRQSVYEETTDLDCFDFIETSYNDAENMPLNIGDSRYDIQSGYCIRIKNNANLLLSGKVTLPSYYNGKPIIEIDELSAFGWGNSGAGNSRGYQITHIFWKQSAQEPCSLRKIGDYSFASTPLGGNRKNVALKYIELPNSLRYIGGSAFFCCGNLTTITPVINNESAVKQNAYIFPENLAVIHNMSFNGVLCSLRDKGIVLSKIQIPPSVIAIGSTAFSNLDAAVNETIIGSDTQASGYIYCNDNGWKSIIGGNLPNANWYSHYIYSTDSFTFYYGSAEIEDVIRTMHENGFITGVTNFSLMPVGTN